MALIVSVSACGFRLRGTQQLPESINQVYIASQFAHMPMQRALEQRLSVYQLQNVTQTQAQQDPRTVTIYLQPEELERRLLSVFATGQVAEYELIFSIPYTVQFADQEAIASRIEVLREYQDDPDEVLAKSRELDLVLTEMRNEAADRMIRLLSSQYQSQITFN